MFYLVVLLLVGILLYIYTCNVSTSKIAQLISSIIIILLVICRYEVGYDYHAYYTLIEEKNEELIEYLYSPFSAGLAYVAIYFNTPHLIFVLFGLPTFGLILWGLNKKSENYSLSVFIFLCLFLVNFLTVIRQALAVAICFFAYQWIVERKAFKYILCVVVASLFHSSALIAIPLYWWSKFSCKMIIGFVLLSLLLKPLIVDVLLDLDIYSTYLEEGGFVPRGGGLIQYFFMILFLFCVLIREKNNKEDNMMLFKITSLGIISVLVFGPHLGERISLYFNIYYLLLIPSILSMQKKTCRAFYIVFFYYVMILYFCLLLIYPFVIGVRSFFIPYRFIFLN